MILAEDEKPDPILEEAVDWLLKLRDASPDSEAVRAFDAWVSSSAAHARAWRTARTTWGLMGEAPPVYRHLWDDTAPVHRLPARRRRRTAAAAALASVVLMALVLAFVMPAMMLRFE